MVSPWMENGTVCQYITKYPEADRYVLVSSSKVVAQSLIYLKCGQLVDAVTYLHELKVVSC
jgi:hypothetical protein